MDSLVQEASEELATRLCIDNVTQPTMALIQKDTQSCIKRVKETSELTEKIQAETEAINDMLHSLRSKNEELQSTFAKIDQLELLVNKVKDTYNLVAENLDGMERAVSSSTPSTTFRLGNKKSDIPIQPYFPPPKQIEIFDTTELMSSLSL